MSNEGGTDSRAPSRHPARAIIRLHHAQITIPTGTEEAARRFYCGILGLMEIAKPAALAGRGGFWVQLEEVQIHIGTEEGVEHAATKAHLAYEVTNLAASRLRLTEAGYIIFDGIPIPGYNRFEARDPFGNRIELIQRDA